MSKYKITLASPRATQGDDLWSVRQALKSVSNMTAELDGSGDIIVSYDGERNGLDIILDLMRSAGIEAQVEGIKVQVGTIDVTPPAFAKDNPKAKENAVKAEEAAKELEDILRRKVDFLRDFTKAIINQSGSIASGLVKMGMLTTDAVDLEAEFAEIDLAHTQASEKFLAALNGR